MHHHPRLESARDFAIRVTHSESFERMVELVTRRDQEVALKALEETSLAMAAVPPQDASAALWEVWRRYRHA